MRKRCLRGADIYIKLDGDVLLLESLVKSSNYRMSYKILLIKKGVKPGEDLSGDLLIHRRGC